MATRVHLKRYRSIIIILSIFRCCVFFVLFFFCIVPLVARAAVTHFPSARARVHTHTPHTHARAGTRERTHTHMHTHANTSSSSSTPFSSRLLHLFSSSCANNMRNNYVTNPFFVFFFSFY